MKIAFWGSMHGQPGTTSNLMASSIYMCAHYQKRVAVLQTHISMNNLSFPLAGISDGNDSFRDSGIDVIMRDIKSKPLTESVIKTDCISRLGGQYSLFLGTGNRDRDSFEKDMEMYFNAIVKEIDRYNDYVYIDVSSGYGELSKKIVSQADILVVNLSQNRRVIEEYFDSPFEHKNTYFVIGSYDPDSRYSIHQLGRIYPQLKRRTYCTLRNSGYMDAQNDGQAVDFFLKNMDCMPYSTNYEFMQSVADFTTILKERGDAYEGD